MPLKIELIATNVKMILHSSMIPLTENVLANNVYKDNSSYLPTVAKIVTYRTVKLVTWILLESRFVPNVLKNIL